MHLKELRNYKRKLFLYRQKHSQHFKIKLLFFTINLPFVTLNQTPTYRKLNLPHMQYLFILLTCRNARATETNQSIRFYCLKRNDPQTLKSGSSKTLFSSVYVIGTTCVDEYFLFYMITGRHYFS